MTQSTVRARLMASSMITGVALAALSAGGAFAQTAPTQGTPAATAAAPGGATTTADNGAAAVTEFVVTGSRIPQPNLTSIAPVTSVSSQEFKLQGTTRVEDLINNLPQVVADQGGNISNGSTGTATVDLRGLGAVRTLVLIDGRRLVPGDPTDPLPDLNFIPAALVDRVEVDTAGASAVYGSDAVAGVVNFIMKRDFEGVRLDVNYSIFQNNNGNTNAQQTNAAAGFSAPTGNVFDGNTVDVTAIIGANTPDGKGNVEGYVGYRHIDPVLQNSRDYSNCAESLDSAGTGFNCGGSSTNPLGRFLAFNSNFNTVTDSSLAVPGPGFTPYTGAGAQTYNYAPANYYQRPDERYTGGFLAHYDITPHLTAYSEFMFMDDNTVAQVAPGGVFGVIVTIPCNDPLLVGNEEALICTDQGYGGPGQPTANPNVEILRRNVEGGNRTTDFRHTDYRAVIGLKGDLGENWHFDAYGQYGASIFSESNGNYFSNSRIPNAFDVVPGPGGVPTCESVINGSDPTCIPYNIFSLNGVTPAALAYLTTPGLIQGQDTEQVVSGSITGDLTHYGLKSPFAHDGAGIAVGSEYRRETLLFTPDKAVEDGDLAGGVGAQPPLAGAFDVKELFGEVRVPLVQDAPFIKDLSFEGGYRFSHYSLAGDTNAYKISGDWAINDDIRIRGGFNRAVRAPNINELFGPQSIGNSSGNDPCSGPIGSVSLVYSAAQCANTGVSAGQYGKIINNPANQYNGLTGGNLNLTPETANTYSLGVVITPHSLVPGLSLSADYFNIKVSNVITTVPFQTVLDQCATTGNPQFCGDIHRSPGTGSLFLEQNGFVTLTLQNLGFLKTSGVDFTADYRTSFRDMGMGDWGGLALSFLGTYTHNNDTEVIPGVLIQCIGEYGAVCGNPQPRFRSTTRLTYTPAMQGFSGLSLSVNWRYFGPTSVDTIPPTAAGANCAGCHIESYNWFDLSAQYRFRDRYTLRAGVNNIFDRDPPIVGSAQLPVGFGNGNTFPQVYDALGRYMFVGLTADF